MAMAESFVDHDSVDTEIARLRDLDLAGLRARWRTIFRRTAADHLPRRLMFRVLAYRLQAERFGDLDKSTQRFLDRVASGAQAGGEIKTVDAHPARNGLQPGTILVREWNGVLQRVTVLDEHFAWNGRTFRSLTEVAFAMTGTRWSGPRFFGLRDRRKKSA
jgi:Protein of unknown function (DUF2924)